MPDMGVSGGVVHGSPLNDGFAAATLGTIPIIGVGLLIMGCEDSVAIDEMEFDRVGLGGGGGAGEYTAAGVGGLSKEAGAAGAVGVGTGVGLPEAAEEMVMGEGWRRVGTCPVNGCPSSPGLKAKVEQKPSEELMISVRPSADLAGLLA